MSKKFFSSLIGASLLLSAISIISKGFGFIREIVYADSFGIGEAYNVFLVAAALPILINTTINYLGQNYFIPLYHEKKNKSETDARLFFQSSFWSFIFLGIAVSAILLLTSNFIIDFYLKESSNNIKAFANNIFQIYIITIPFIAGSSILSAHLNSNLLFKYPAFSQLILNTVVVIILILLNKILDVYVIPVAINIAVVCQLVFLILFTRKSLFKSLNIKVVFNSLFKSITPRLIIILTIEVVSLSYVLIDRYFYGEVHPGGIASLNYALALFGLPISIFSMAIATAIFPKFSYNIFSNGEWRVEFDFNRALTVSLIFFVVITIVFLITGEPIIKLFFERGKFTGEGTTLTYSSLKYLSLGLIFYSSYAIINKLLYSASLLKHLILINVIAVISKLLLSILLVKYLQQDGLALSTSISYFLLFLLGYIFCVKKLGFKNRKFLPLKLAELLVCAFVAFVVSKLILMLISIDSTTYIFLEVIIFISVFAANILFANSENREVLKLMIVRILGRA